MPDSPRQGAPRARRRASWLALPALLAACGGDDGPPPAVATAIVAVDATPRSGTAGAALAQPLQVRVLDQNGNPFANTVVSFAVAEGGGTLGATLDTTDAQGVASTTLRLGPAVGVNRVTATATRGTTPLLGSPLSIVATGDDGLIIQGQVSVARQSLLTLPLFTPAALRADATLPIRPSAAFGDPEPTIEAPHRLVIRYRDAALGTPGLMATGAWQSPATVREVVQELHALTDAIEHSAPVTLRDVSPVLAAARVDVAPNADLAQVAAQLARRPEVLSVTPEAYGSIGRYDISPIPTAKAGASPVAGSPMAQTLPGATLPNDPLLDAQLWGFGMIEAPRAWALQRGSENVIVAVIDDGARFDHPAIGTVYTRDGYNFISPGFRITGNRTICGTSGGGTLDNMDTVRDTAFTGYRNDPTQLDNFSFSNAQQCWARSTGGGHGLHVAGTIGAIGNDSVGTTGVAQRVRIRPIRVCGVTPACSTDFDLAQSILYAAGLPASDGRGGTLPVVPRAAIANMSLGGYPDTPVLRDAVTAAFNAGMLLVASAGNTPSALNFLPAAYPNVISVAAIGPDANLTDYSTIGSTIDLVAPGGTFRFGPSGGAVASTTFNFVTRAGNYSFYSGTSMAAPHVTGVAALVLSQNPGLSAAALRARLEQTAVDMGPAGRDNSYGFGLVNARAALTGTMPQTATLVRLVNAATGDSLATATVGQDGSFRFARLAAGTAFSIFGGQDEDGDRRSGVSGRRLGWFGGARPAEVTLTAGQAPVPAAFQIGLPLEAEPNNDASSAMPLPLGGWMVGAIVTGDAADVYRVRIPRAGSYVVETFGLVGGCGNGLELDTAVDVLDPNGTVLGTNDDTVFPGSRFCSRVTLSLPAGTTFVRVRGFNTAALGQYRVVVRPA